MKKIFVVMSILLLNFAFLNTVKAEDLKIAVVNVPKIIETTSQVQALKREQQSKMQEIQKWLDTVRADVQKQSTKENREKLIKKYDVEFTKKQDLINKSYATKLQAIDKSITETITTEAKTLGYNMVIAKSVVLYGGKDITSEIMKKVK